MIIRTPRRRTEHPTLTAAPRNQNALLLSYKKSAVSAVPPSNESFPSALANDIAPSQCACLTSGFPFLLFVPLKICDMTAVGSSFF